MVPFTRDTWNGRMKACRGVGASMDPDTITKWETEHMKMLTENAPEAFEVLHHAATAILRKR